MTTMTVSGVQAGNIGKYPVPEAILAAQELSTNKYVKGLDLNLAERVLTAEQKISPAERVTGVTFAGIAGIKPTEQGHGIS